MYVYSVHNLFSNEYNCSTRHERDVRADSLQKLRHVNTNILAVCGKNCTFHDKFEEIKWILRRFFEKLNLNDRKLTWDILFATLNEFCNA